MPTLPSHPMQDHTARDAKGFSPARQRDLTPSHDPNDPRDRALPSGHSTAKLDRLKREPW
ncbi:hypothetical protein [Spirulina major]|uniref:hypothetical protein n=1 Tax=Spirulina major TaxID=270636 RepID=UPI001114CC9D|nr:hypothetical protein [Spirulina major]